MAFKRYAKKTYKRGKSAWYNKKYSAKDIALKALKNTRYLKGLVNSETFHKDSNYSGSLGAQYNITPITNIAQGDSESQRTGNSILLRNIYLRLQFTINAATTLSSTYTMALIKDTQQISDTQPAITDIFNSQTAPSTMMNLNTSGRFKLIWRRTNILTPASGGRPAMEITKYWKVYDHVRFNGSASTDYQKNAYFFIIITSEPTNFITVDGNIRVGYHDN